MAARRLPGSDQECVKEERALAVGAQTRHHSVEGEEHGDDIGGRGGVDDIAAHRGDVSDLMTPDDLCALHQSAQASPERRMSLQRAVRHEAPQRHRAIDAHAIETGHPMQAHDVPWAQLAAAYLDDEIGSPGQEAAVRSELRAEGDGLGQRGRLVVLEGHVLSWDKGAIVTGRRRVLRLAGLTFTSHEPSRTNTVKPGPGRTR